MTYRYKIKFSMVTKKPIAFRTFREHYENDDEAKQQLYNEMLARLPSAIVQGFADQGETVSVVESEIVNFELIRVGWQGYDVVLRVNAKATIETESNYFGSPIAPLVIIAIGVAIALIAAAITVPPLIAEWLQSMTTETWTVEQYDAEGNLIKKETGSQPSLGGMTILFVFLIIGVVILAMFWQKRRD